MMRKRLVALVAAVAMVLTFAPIANAAYWSLHESSCTGYMVGNSACWKENADGGGDIILLMQSATTSIINMQNVATPAGTQCLGLFANTHWSDCVSWVSYNILPGYELCAWRNSSYGGTLFLDITGPLVGNRNITGDANDSISSVSLEPIPGGHC